MGNRTRVFFFFAAACAVTCFGVFVMPFFFPAAYASVVSVSNDAGFNNKLAAVAAAVCASAVYGLSIFAPRVVGELSGWRDPRDMRGLPRRLWAAAVLVAGLVTGGAGWLIVDSKARYQADFGYFVNQMSSFLFSHRQLYTQIEFPYGPLLFYPPILLHQVFGHMSLRMCFLIVLVLHQLMGLLALGYVINRLPMSRGWKIFALCCFGPITIEPMMSLNYTLLRFTIPLATLAFSIRPKSARATTILFGIGMALNLAVSPEMGFAFGAGAVAYALLKMRFEGKVWLWAMAVIPAAAGLFLLVAGRPYLRMLSLFAGGMYNFIVEPLPHVLLFLLATVWLVPRMLASQSKTNPDEAALLGSIFVLSMALVPVAFGRADPMHVLLDGIGMFLLSFVAMSVRPRWQQLTWGACLATSVLLGYVPVLLLGQSEIREVIRREALQHTAALPTRVLFRFFGVARPETLERYQHAASWNSVDFEEDALDAVVGGEKVATPYMVPLEVEEQMRSRGLYQADFYFYMTAVLDAAGEERKIRAFNQSLWAMLPAGPEYRFEETQAVANSIMGISLPYRAKRLPYIVGARFSENLHENWRPVGTVGQFIVYCNMLRNARCEKR